MVTELRTLKNNSHHVKRSTNRRLLGLRTDLTPQLARNQTTSNQGWRWVSVFIMCVKLKTRLSFYLSGVLSPSILQMKSTGRPELQ